MVLESIARIIKVQLPAYLKRLPVPESITGFARLTEKLKKARAGFVKSVNSAVLKDLIDDLLDELVFSSSEAETIGEGMTITRDKARALIDIVIRKGDKASETLLTSIQNRDSHLFAVMGIEVQQGEASQRNMARQETEVQPSTQAEAAALGSNEEPPSTIPSQQTCSPEVENRITLCPLEVFNRIRNDEAGQIYDIKGKNCRKRLALIISNREFDSLKERKGTEHDETGMAHLLQGLGYKVDIKKNLSSQEMETALKNFSSRPEHEESDSTFIVFASHGLRDGICGKGHHEDKSDVLPTDKVFNIFNNKNCKGLRGKPKVIIIQACRGEKNGAVWVPDSIDEAPDACPVSSSKDLDDAMQKVLLESDFLCFCSSTPDTVSWRSETTGSFFIQQLIKIIQKEAWTCCLDDLFRKVQLAFNTSGRQMPTIERTTAMKKFYLFPGH